MPSSANMHQNPYSGWSAARSSSAGAPPPSLFGALPYPTPPDAAPTSAPPLTAFVLTALTRSVLNCAIVDAQGRVRYRVSTDDALPGYTVFKRLPPPAARGEAQSVALIEWHARAARVEVRGAVPKQDVRDWLRTSSDQRQRIMTLRGAQYSLVPHRQDVYVDLYASGVPLFLGRISRGESESVFVELTADALQLGILDAAVVVAVLLHCGLDID